MSQVEAETAAAEEAARGSTAVPVSILVLTAALRCSTAGRTARV